MSFAFYLLDYGREACKLACEFIKAVSSVIHYFFNINTEINVLDWYYSLPLRFVLFSIFRCIIISEMWLSLQRTWIQHGALNCIAFPSHWFLFVQTLFQQKLFQRLPISFFVWMTIVWDLSLDLVRCASLCALLKNLLSTNLKYILQCLFRTIETSHFSRKFNYTDNKFRTMMTANVIDNPIQ